MNLLVANNKTVTTIMLVIGIICFLLAFLVIFFYRKKIKKEKADQDGFKVKEFQTKYKIFYFWNHVVYILIIFTLFVASIVLVTVGIGSLVS